MAEEQRACVTGVDPDARADVPSVWLDYEEAPELQEIGEALIEAHDEFAFLRDGRYKIAYYWRQKAGKKGGEPVVAKAFKPSGLTKVLLKQATFYVVVAASEAMFATNLMLEAIVYHELCHFGEDAKVDDDGVVTYTPKLVNHDLEMFRSEVNRYGLWYRPLREAAESFAAVAGGQLPLDLAAPDSDDVASATTESGRTVTVDLRPGATQTVSITPAEEPSEEPSEVRVRRDRDEDEVARDEAFGVERASELVAAARPRKPRDIRAPLAAGA